MSNVMQNFNNVAISTKEMNATEGAWCGTTGGYYNNCYNSCYTTCYNPCYTTCYSSYNYCW